MALVKSVESDEQPFPFLDLPPEIRCHILRKLQISITEIHKLEEVSKEIRGIVASIWKRNFYNLPPKILIKILNETQMQSSDFRRMKLVSKDMKYLIERDGGHLTQKSFHTFYIVETPSGDCKIDWVGMPTQLGININDFSRIFTYCSFDMMFIDRVTITSHLCDQLQNLRRKKVSINSVTITRCKIVGIKQANAIDSILNTTRLRHMEFIGDRMEKDVFSLPSVRKVDSLMVEAASDFNDDDMNAACNAYLSIYKCCLSEHALRTLLEDISESKRYIETFDFYLRNEIDVDSLLRDLPNLEKTAEAEWRLMDVNGKIFNLNITPKGFLCYTRPYVTLR